MAITRVQVRCTNVRPENRRAYPISTSSTPPKLIPEERVPIEFIGKMVLDRNPTNFFAETEQVAFTPAISCRESISPMIPCSGPPSFLH